MTTHKSITVKPMSELLERIPTVIPPLKKRIAQETSKHTQTSAIRMIERNGGTFKRNQALGGTVIHIQKSGIKIQGCIDFLTQKKYGFKRALPTQ